MFLPSRKEDKLHLLIRSLSTSEKRYFRLFAGRHASEADNNYMRLFDSLDRLESYDKAALLRDLEGQGISAKHLSSDKNYLYGLILKSLSAFYAGRTPTQRVVELLHQVELLYERGLFDQGFELADKARRLAETHELQALALVAAAWERKAYERQGNIPQLQRLLAEGRDLLGRVDNLFAYVDLYYRLVALCRQAPRPRSAAERAAFEAVFRHPFMDFEETSLSREARRYFWRIHVLYHEALGRRSALLAAARRLLGLIREEGEAHAEDESLHLEARLIALEGAAERPEAFEARVASFLEVLRGLRKSRQALIRWGEAEAWHLRFGYYGAKSERHWLLEREAAFRQALDELGPSMWPSQHARCCLALGEAALLAGDPRRGLPWVNRLLTAGGPELLREDDLSARLLNLALHSSLGNYSLVGSESLSLLRAWKGRESDYAAELPFVRLLARVAREEPPALRDCAAAIGECLAETEAILAASPQDWPFNGMNLPAWLRNWLAYS